MPPPFPQPKGYSVARRGGILFLVLFPSVLAMDGNSHEKSRGARYFLCAYHMNQVCGLGPHLHVHEYK